jgi:hypothetical protein
VFAALRRNQTVNRVLITVVAGSAGPFPVAANDAPAARFTESTGVDVFGKSFQPNGALGHIRT